MNRRSEPCRNFQRGSCQYGDRCKFIHVAQTKSKSNPFGFGSQNYSQFPQTSQQLKSNPFGFGVQDTSQLRGATNFGIGNQNSSKPFENKWIRPTAATNSAPSQHADNKKQAAEHECMDPESCKRQIAEDLKNEMPVWKLTCYGHWKGLPCDVIGDVSYEELRATAYEDAKRGLPLQSTVERERSMLNSKLAEFDNLLRKQFPLSSNATAVSPLSNRPPTFSSFSQLGASASVAPIMGFGNQLPGTPSNTVFSKPSFPRTAGPNSGVSELKFGTSGSFGVQQPLQQFRSSLGPSNSGFTNVSSQQFGSSTRPSSSGITNSFMAMGSEQSPLHSISPQFVSSNANQSPGWDKLGQSAVNQATAVLNNNFSNSREKQDVASDDSIWSKEWDIGEIPVEAPPESVCFDISYQILR